MSLVNPPQVLVRRDVAVDVQRRLLATGVPAATVTSGAAVGADGGW